MTFDIDKDSILDNTPLVFGKFKGRTPTQLVDSEGKTELGWLKWAYENVTNFPVCSEALYKSIGGRLSRAKQAAKSTAPSGSDTGFDDRYGSRGVSRAPRPAGGFDDMDDDIPF